jgi:hypothetical protein
MTPSSPRLRIRAALLVELSRGANAELLRLAQNRELCGFLDDAAKGYEAAAVIAERQGNRAVLAAALRHRAVLHHHASESHEAARLCRRSFELAEALGHEGLAAEALNTLGGLELETGELDLARHSLGRHWRSPADGTTSRRGSSRTWASWPTSAAICRPPPRTTAAHSRCTAGYATGRDARSPTTIWAS